MARTAAEIRAYKAAWRQRNREHVNEEMRRWRREHPQQTRETAARSRARVRSTPALRALQRAKDVAYYRRRYRQDPRFREMLKEYHRQYRLRHHEKILAKKKAHYQRHRKRLLAEMAAYQKAHRPQLNEAARQRRVVLKGLGRSARRPRTPAQRIKERAYQRSAHRKAVKKAWNARQRQQLTDRYIANVIYKCALKDLSTELIEAMRAIILVRTASSPHKGL